MGKEDFIEMCNYIGINVKMFAVESPWSNGIVECNNQTLKNMKKIISDI